MGKPSLIAIALLTLLTIPKAHGATLLCKETATGEFFTGTFSGEMQSPVLLTCDEVSTSSRGREAFLSPTAAAACCSWSEGPLIPGCMPGC